MSKENKITKRESNADRKKVIHKRKQFTSKIYSARLPFEDARILNDYAKANNLDHSEVVRLGLHQFALRQQMKFRAKDPLREIQEQVVAEQIAPIKSRLDEMTAVLNELTNVLFELHQSSKKSTSFSVEDSHNKFQEGDLFKLFEQQYAEQKKMLERILVATTLALRLNINYIVDPVLSKLEKSEIENHLRAAERGRENWNANTREVVKRTGSRILVELNFLNDKSLASNSP